MFWRTVCSPSKNACVHAWEGGIKEKGGKKLEAKRNHGNLFESSRRKEK